MHFSVIRKEIIEMLVHEFIAVKRTEVVGKVEYNLVRTHPCVRVPDNIILNNRDFLSGFKVHWECVGRVYEGLAYHGITLILHEDLKPFMDVLEKYKEDKPIKALIVLCHEALEQGKDIVHFGI